MLIARRTTEAINNGTPHPQSPCQSLSLIMIFQGAEHSTQPTSQPPLLPGLLGEVAPVAVGQESPPLRLQHQLARILSQVQDSSWLEVEPDKDQI